MKRGLLRALKVLVFIVIVFNSSKAYSVFTFNDLEFIVGSGPNEAALVIDFDDGLSPLAWGYRWEDTAMPTGEDMFRAIVAADGNLTSTIVDFGFGTFAEAITYDRGVITSSESSSPFLGNFWAYYVNAPQTAGDFSSTTHGAPNGEPFDGGGTFNSSNTGHSDRPLSNGSWDGYVWSDGSLSPSEPIAAALPEPSSVIYLILSAIYFFSYRRKRKAYIL